MITVRAMRAEDLAAATRVFRVAFGTFVGLPDPETFAADRDYFTARFGVDPAAAFVAEEDGRVVGSNLATIWGSFGFFGPLTVLPEYWDRGVGQLLLAPVMALFGERGVREAGLFTFLQSPKHLGLYQRVGFWPGFPIALMEKKVGAVSGSAVFTRYSEAGAGLLERCRALTDSIFAGLDVGIEIRAVAEHGLGDTVLVLDGEQVAGFAVCHCGAGTEAGAGNCYVKFAAVRPGAEARAWFDRLLGECEAFAAERGLETLVAGVNFERLGAYQALLMHGFRVGRQALAMSRDGLRAYNGPEVYVLDDWR